MAQPGSDPADPRVDPQTKAAEGQTEAAAHSNSLGNIRPEDLEKVVDKMNQTVKLFSHALQFSVSNSHRVIIKVIDTESGEVIRQIPPEALVDAFQNFDKMIGVLFDKKV
jgi:flagellar protein FlaG